LPASIITVLGSTAFATSTVLKLPWLDAGALLALRLGAALFVAPALGEPAPLWVLADGAATS